MKNTFKRVSSLVFSLVLLGAVVFVWLQRIAIYDWWRLRGYTAPTAISVLADHTTMNPSTRHLFYVYHPELDDRSTFNDHCRENTEQTIVLGCYVSHNGIYLFDIKDERLNGVQEVTAAHETLHVAYERLRGSDKKHVDDMVNHAYAQVTDERIKANVENYRKNGADVTNELHSILGTEVRNLPPELEQYYQRYFEDRAKVVNYSEQYEKVFNDRKNQIADYDTQLASLKSQVTANQQTLHDMETDLNAQRSQLDGLLSAKRYSEYNNGVSAFNDKVRAYNALASTTKQQIARYNQIVEQRNALALEEQSLVKALDSRIDTQQQK